MQIRLPKPRVPLAERDISLHQIAARWQRPVWYVRNVLLMASVPLKRVPQPSIEGVSGRDLLEFEQRFSSIEIDNLLSASASTVVGESLEETAR